MLLRVSFVGAPGSGKTTAASAAFGALKEMGILSEFVPEYARIHISRERSRIFRQENFQSLLQADQRSREPLLSDGDQAEIFKVQRSWERWCWDSLAREERAVAVSDTSPWNTLLYFADQAQQSKYKQLLLEDAGISRLGHDLVFFALLPSDTDADSHADPNRIHSAGQAEWIQKKILDVVAPHLPLIPLSGPPTFRLATVLTRIDAALRTRK